MYVHDIRFGVDENLGIFLIWPNTMPFVFRFVYSGDRPNAFKHHKHIRNSVESFKKKNVGPIYMNV